MELAIIDPSGSIVDKINITNEGVITLNEIVEVDKTLFWLNMEIKFFDNFIIYFF